MKREALLVRPLFYDVLSGGFRPPSDPEQRTHTLARLAFASVQKGAETVPVAASSPFRFFTDRPGLKW